MRVRNKAADNAKDGERVDLHVCVIRGDVALVQRDEAVVFLVHVNVLDDAVRNELF